MWSLELLNFDIIGAICLMFTVYMLSRTSLWMTRASLSATTLTVTSPQPPGSWDFHSYPSSVCLWLKLQDNGPHHDPHHFSYVDMFAASNDDFIQEFGSVFAKMISRGYDNLSVIS